MLPATCAVTPQAANKATLLLVKGE